VTGKRRRRLAFVGTVVLALVLGLVAAATGGLIQVRNPENATGHVAAPPALTPPVPVEH
jgi:hypothetical protein